MKALGPEKVARYQENSTQAQPLTKRQERLYEEVMLEINMKLSNMVAESDSFVQMEFRNDLRSIISSIAKAYQEAGWSKVKYSYTDNGWRDPNPVTRIKFYFPVD